MYIYVILNLFKIGEFLAVSEKEWLNNNLRDVRASRKLVYQALKKKEDKNFLNFN
jgi:hypothetical protein